jgi:predicted DNA-binding antitoxin AbrB/MazE fold protein
VRRPEYLLLVKGNSVPTSALTSEGQITLPKEIREHLQEAELGESPRGGPEQQNKEKIMAAQAPAICSPARLAHSHAISGMRPVEALYEEGLLKPETPLALRSGERVALIVIRLPDPKRWDLERLAKGGAGEDLELASQGLAEWAAALDEEDRG